MHSHDDAALFRPGGLAPKLGQGVTTSVIGNCGLGVAPSAAALLDSAGPVLGAFPDDHWVSFGSYLTTVAAEARAVNTVALVPHAPLRIAAMGAARRPATPAESERMAGIASDALDAGAAGISLGLMYSPGDAAERPELLALARAVAAHDRLLVAHIRNEADHLRASIDELAGLGREAGAAVHVSHLKVTGPRNAGSMPGIIDHLEGLRASGLDITADVYPYDAGSTTVVSLFPPWAQEGGAEGLLGRLRDVDNRAEVLASLTAPWTDTTLENQWAAIGPEKIVVVGFDDPALSDLEGLTVAEVAVARDQQPLEALADLVLLTSAQLTVILFHTDLEGMKTALAWPHTLVGSDGLPRENGTVHPRLFGTFSRALTLGVLPRGEMIRKMTQDAALRFGIAGRGRIAPGFAADLQLVDAGAYADRATFASPRLSPAGLVTTYVNGVRADVAPAGLFLPAGTSR
ncbi:dihydroorotase [Frondihabitans sucicola]|uniref:Dihydroorotase n=1 Tax=Frondihabitans sucicola TaxID=1268041 RepID=A0ABM8GLB4_9MICO|nr:dihydroorotase [Frondihabitans sucicola]